MNEHPLLSRIRLDYASTGGLWLTRQSSLRKLVGILGMLMPVLLMGFLYLFSGHASPLDSISHYYYTRAGSVFTIIVSLLAIFLLIYKGEEPIDFILSSVAGVFALCVLLFPTTNISTVCCQLDKPWSVTYLKDSSARVNFHFLSAALFLLSLAAMSFFLFTKSDKPVGERGTRKVLRNRIYRFCAVMMLAGVAVIAANALGWISEEVFTRYHLTFWMETLAVEAFGFSWLVKGGTVFPDLPMSPV
jgi:hypothetical protein